MKNILKYLLSTVLLVNLSACEDWLEREPTEILLNDQVWSDPKMATSVLANLYNRLDPEGGFSVNGILSHTDVDDGMWSGGLGGNNRRNTRADFGNTFRNYWNYDLVRDVNLFLENVEASKLFTPQEKQQLVAEGRFIRAYVYFLFVRSMGGVPLILDTYTYNGPEDVESMQVPRSTEVEIYDFIAQELDEIKETLGNDGSKTRANKWTALALKSRAMLYAGSIAKYNDLMASPITTSGGEVGIPPSRAQDYYQQSLDASKEIIEQGQFSLYNNNPDKGQNFYEALTDKSSQEVIWAYDHTLDGKFHFYTWENIPRSMREAGSGSTGLVPTLNLVEAFDYLDGSPGTLKVQDDITGDYIYYDNPEDIFANKDARFYGTVIYPGSSFANSEVSIQRGVLEWDGTKYVTRQSNELGSIYEPDGGLLVGADGPLPNTANVTNTGFFTRKYLDDRSGAAQRGQGSDVWWIYFRLGEILLNAAEAAFELGQPEALTYVNLVRERAGFEPNSLTSLTIEDIRNERQVELSFEEHRFWDLKRWRIAHQVFNGLNNSQNAEKWALWPYRVYRPADPTKHNKYVFQKVVAPRFTRPLFFEMRNYYAAIPQDALDKNPLLVKNPFH